MQISRRLRSLRGVFAIAVLVVSAWFFSGGVMSAPAEPGAADETKLAALKLRVQPESLTLVHPRRPHSILVTRQDADGRSIDLSSQATYRSSNESVAKVDAAGWIQPIGSGAAEITVTVDGVSVAVKTEVKLPEATPDHSFRHDVMPVLSKAGCNSGSCHGYSLGKNGFKLSLRGADSDADYLSVSDEFFERRINRHDPEASLLLTKPLGETPHKGGVRFDRDSLLHKLVLGWIADGAPADAKTSPVVESVQVCPTAAVVSPGMQHQVQLIARYSDGTTRDVTRLGVYGSNTEAVARVDDEGLITAVEEGETAIVCRFERIFATANFIVLEPNRDFRPTAVPTGNLVDRHVIEKLNALRITPAGKVDDTRFMRRVMIDLIGLQPRPDELAAFVADDGADKRSKLVDALMQRPEFVDRWSLKWGDLLQNSRTSLTEPAVFAFREWIRSAVATNMPLDKFAYTLLTASGSTNDDPTTAFFAASKDTDDTLQRVTQVFCGVRMACAKCHPHPFENWTQADYYGLHTFLNQVGVKPDPRLRNTPNAKAVTVNTMAGLSTNPRTGQGQKPRYLGGGEPEISAGVDRRVVYARWLTSPDNPHFARSLTNRIWSYLFHRGIIDPVDDLRTTNPPINGPLLDALTADFVDHKFDFRHLLRTIVLSDTYQRNSGKITGSSSASGEANFARFVPRRIPAEALMDSLAQAVGVPESYGGAPSGFTAKQLPDASIEHDVLGLFGKPQRMEACECERDDGSNMLQALYLINGPAMLKRVSAPGGRVAALLKEKLTDENLVEQIYLWTLARKPEEQERQASLEFFKSKGDKRDEAAQDLMWALVNSRDFMLIH